MDVSGILQVVKESRLIYPDPEKEKRTTIGSRQAFEKLLKESHENPEKFWADVARDFVWFKPWKKTMRGKLPDFEFFSGGITNPCVNLLDRHIERERGAANRTAIIWEGENGDTKFYTYQMLLAEVNRFANAMRSFGVKKGDGVAIFLPNIAEAFIAVLACFRIGAVYNTIFSGYSEKSLKNRLVNFEPKVIIT